MPFSIGEYGQSRLDSPPGITTLLRWDRDVKTNCINYTLEASTIDRELFVANKRVILLGRRVCAGEVLYEKDIVRSGQLINTLIEVLRSRIAPLLFEWDPRIGQTPEEFQRGTWLDEGVFHSEVCGLCKTYYPPLMWGGGNIGWVHPECWIEFALP